jgi:hypothetical protein
MSDKPISPLRQRKVCSSRHRMRPPHERLENYGVVFSGIQVVEISPCLRMAKAENQRGPLA